MTISEERKVDVLDPGFVRLVNHMGSDLSIVRSARVSHDARSQQLGGIVEIARLSALRAALVLLLQSATNTRRKNISIAGSIGHDWT